MLLVKASCLSNIVANVNLIGGKLEDVGSEHVVNLNIANSKGSETNCYRSHDVDTVM